MAKNKTQDVDSIVARADKFWARGNYPLAEKEYLKALHMGYQGDVSHRLERCQAENAKAKSKELSKKGKTQLRKENFQAALRLFEQAYALDPQTWLQEKMEELQGQVTHDHALQEACTAEAQGDFHRAMQIYTTLCTSQDTPEHILLKKAACHVKTGDYKAAVHQYSDLHLASSADRYHYGFALIKTGDLYAGLQVWEKMRGTCSEQQWRQLQAQRDLVITELARTLTESTTSGLYKDDPVRMWKMIHFVQVRISDEGIRQDLQHLPNILITHLWDQQRYEDIVPLLAPPSADMESRQIRNFAKLYFRLAQKTGEYLNDLRTFWLTAVHDPESFSPDTSEADRPRIRNHLIHLAEDVLQNKNQGVGTSNSPVCTGWNTDKNILEKLSKCAEDSKSQPCWLCSPEFAHRFNRSQDMLQLIWSWKECFEDHSEYLRIGGYYSPIGPSLYLLDQGDPAAALQKMPQADDDEEGFARHGRLKIYFGYMMHCLHTGTDQPERYARKLGLLFDNDPSYEHILIKEATKVLDASFETLVRYEAVLQKIHAQRSSPIMAQTLSLLMSNRAVSSYNRNMISDEILVTQLKQALNVDAHNDHAQKIMRQTLQDIEVNKIHKAMDNGQFQKAGKLAAQSEYDEVRDSFWEEVQDVLEHIKNLSPNQTQTRNMLLGELHKSVRRVDPDHPVVKSITQML